VAERAVVEAYGKTEAVVDVAVKFAAKTFPPKTPESPTESWRYGDVVPIPTFPADVSLNVSAPLLVRARVF
jgi:hypothetical protein